MKPERARELIKQLDTDWTPELHRQVERRIEHRLAQPKSGLARPWLPVSAFALTAVALFVWNRTSQSPEQTQTASPEPQASPRVMRLPVDDNVLLFADGSRAEPMDAISVLQRRVGGVGDGVVVEILQGGAHFSVVPGQDRIFRVAIGLVDVEVLGTTFDVEKQDDGVHVSVRSGRVRVTWPDGQAHLGAGEGGVYPPIVPAPTRRGVTSASGNHATWRRLALDGRYDDAYRDLAREPKAVRDDPNDLLLAADVARLSGHPAEAVEPLSRLVQRFGDDARAVQGAMMLGRVLLNALDEPARAAQAFATARRLAPQGVLAEDALAREIEALVKAGDRERARALAETYRRTYPDGARLPHVRRITELP